MTHVTRKVMALAPADLTTTKGMARHLAALGKNQPTRGVAVEWFCKLPVDVRMALIESVRTNVEDVRELLYLVPDATELMVHLDISVLRRVCDNRVGFMSSVEPARCIELVRATANDDAKRWWLIMILDAFENDREKFQAIVDTIHGPELATFFADLFRYGDLECIADARHDPEFLEEILDEHYPFIAALFHFDPERYLAFLDHLTLTVTQLNERKTRLRTNEELMKQYWPRFMRDVADYSLAELEEDIDEESEEGEDE